MKIPSFILAVLLLCPFAIPAQETVFGILKSDLQHAAEHLANRNYHPALNLYLQVSEKYPDRPDLFLNIARCHFYLKQYDKAIQVYGNYRKQETALPAQDLFLLAESLASTGKYEDAIATYREYLEVNPEDQTTFKKIWRLTNVHYLYEDSLHFAIRPVGFNTRYGELCPIPYNDGLMFLSNRKELKVVEKIDGAINAPFYRIYFSKAAADSTGIVGFDRPLVVRDKIGSRYHTGPFRFYSRGKKVIFASNADSRTGRVLPLQLFFGEEMGNKWVITGAFPYNSSEYSISDPAISEDGTVLYFSSDMKGGLGGRDIYRSEFVSGKWTKPVNMGESINTAFDEVFPYIHQGKTLYFSSNGHAGMGGLDIFKTEINTSVFQDPQNVGYPLNSRGDDFGIVVDSMHTHGFISSNRKNGGFDDDIYEFDMDLQTYPVELSGKIRFKEHAWSDSSTLKVFPSARLVVVDHDRNVQVYDGMSDDEGNFSIVIPYFSKFKIKVIGEDRDEHIVSLEIPKHRKNYSTYEIVIVKDAFKENHAVK